MASDKTKAIGGELSAAIARGNAGVGNYGIQNKKQIEKEVNSIKEIQNADWSGVDSKTDSLRGLANAFMQQYANGSDIARAQNSAQAANFARNVASGNAGNFNQIQNAGEQLVSKGLENTAKGTQANFQQGQQATQSVQQAAIQKYAMDMQRTFANMSIARAKKQILDNVSLADRSGIQSATALQDKVAAQKANVDIGIQDADWRNNLQLINLLGGIAQGGLAVGSGLAKKSVADSSSVYDRTGSVQAQSPSLTVAPDNIFVGNGTGSGYTGRS